MALKDIYHADNLTDDNYQAISEAIREANQPGLIDRCLGKLGKITAILNCNYLFEQPVSYSYGIMPLPSIPAADTAAFLEKVKTSLGVELNSIDSLKFWADHLLEDYYRQNIIALKMTARKVQTVKPAAVQQALTAIWQKKRSNLNFLQTVNDYLLDYILSVMPQYDFTMAVHTGMFAGANTFFYRSHVRHIVPLLQKHPDVRFDLFHLSFPWTSEAIAIAQKFTNAHLNLTWMPLLNPTVTQRSMREIICAVPANKVLAMGGDYWLLPDVAYGHLKIARNLLTNSLLDCLQAKYLNLNSAKDIARLWLSENAASIYPLIQKRRSI